jgi:hypothetical protein
MDLKKSHNLYVDFKSVEQFGERFTYKSNKPKTSLNSDTSGKNSNFLTIARKTT